MFYYGYSFSSIFQDLFWEGRVVQLFNSFYLVSVFFLLTGNKDKMCQYRLIIVLSIPFYVIFVHKMSLFPVIYYCVQMRDVSLSLGEVICC